MKKIFFMFFLIVLYINVAFGDETTNNSISVGTNYSFGFFPEGISYMPQGINLGYERLLGDKFSFGIEVGSLASFIYPYFEIQGRFYPWAGMFFTELGFGGLMSLLQSDVNNEDKVSMPFPFIFSLEIGWKINIGTKNKWFLSPSIEEILLLTNTNLVFLTNLCLKISYNF